jgi:HEAT repeat protein
MVNLTYGWTHFAWVLAIVFSALVFVLAGFPLAVRAVRFAVDRHAAPLRAALDQWIAGLLDDSVDYGTGLRRLREHPRSARRSLFERLTAASACPSPQSLPTLRRLATDLGLVDLWRRQLARPSAQSRLNDLGAGPWLLERTPGLGFVARAEAAESLGLLQDAESWPELVKALGDSHRAVRSAAARALGRTRAPASFRFLAQKLEDAALGRGASMSRRTLKMALAGFDLAYSAGLAGMLQHPDQRVRFLAADVIAAALQSAADPARNELLTPASVPDVIAGIFLRNLCIDPNPDVRARAADVIPHLPDDRGLAVLLTLLDDSEWFVRLHATRALAECRGFPLEVLRRRLTDSNWRVREAAARAIGARGEEGAGFLLAHFHSTNDRYSREQVVEEIERAGLVPSLGAFFGEAGASEELRSAVWNTPAPKTKPLPGELQEQDDSGDGLSAMPAEPVHLAGLSAGGHRGSLA